MCLHACVQTQQGPISTTSGRKLCTVPLVLALVRSIAFKIKVETCVSRLCCGKCDWDLFKDSCVAVCLILIQSFSISFAFFPLPLDGNSSLAQNIGLQMCCWDLWRVYTAAFFSRLSHAHPMEQILFCLQRLCNTCFSLAPYSTVYLHFKSIFFYFTCITPVTVYWALIASKPRSSYISVLCLSASCADTALRWS